MSSALTMLCPTIAVMAEETAPVENETVVERVAEPLPDGAPEGRLIVGATGFMTQVLQYITGQVANGTTPAATPGAGSQRMVLVANTMPAAGTFGQAPATIFASAATPTTATSGPAITWATVTPATATVAASTQATVNFTGVAPGTYVGYAVYNSAGGYLYSKAFTSITVPAGATGNITVTATHAYDLS